MERLVIDFFVVKGRLRVIGRYYFSAAAYLVSIIFCMERLCAKQWRAAVIRPRSSLRCVVLWIWVFYLSIGDVAPGVSGYRA